MWAELKVWRPPSLGPKEKSRPAAWAPEFHLAKARPLHAPGLQSGHSSHQYQLDLCARPSVGQLQGYRNDRHSLLLSESSQSSWGEKMHTREKVPVPSKRASGTEQGRGRGGSDAPQSDLVRSGGHWSEPGRRG